MSLDGYDRGSQEALLDREKDEHWQQPSQQKNYWLKIWYWSAQVGFFLVSLSLCLHGILNLRECKLQSGATSMSSEPYLGK